MDRRQDPAVHEATSGNGMTSPLRAILASLHLVPAIVGGQTQPPALPPQEQRALATAKQLLGAAYSRLTAYGQALQCHGDALEIFGYVLNQFCPVNGRKNQ